MIKNLFGEDESIEPDRTGTKGKNDGLSIFDKNSEFEPGSSRKTPEARKTEEKEPEHELPVTGPDFILPNRTIAEISDPEDILIEQIEKELNEIRGQGVPEAAKPLTEQAAVQGGPPIEEPPVQDPVDPFVKTAVVTEPPGETARKSGLAMSAAIVLFASVAFMTLLGSFADLNFGTAPWGIVGGVIVGAIIGFVQFFRTTSQILRPPKSDIGQKTLFVADDDQNGD